MLAWSSLAPDGRHVNEEINTHVYRKEYQKKKSLPRKHGEATALEPTYQAPSDELRALKNRKAQSNEGQGSLRVIANQYSELLHPDPRGNLKG